MLLWGEGAMDTLIARGEEAKATLGAANKPAAAGAVPAAAPTADAHSEMDLAVSSKRAGVVSNYPHTGRHSRVVPVLRYIGIRMH